MNRMHSAIGLILLLLSPEDCHGFFDPLTGGAIASIVGGAYYAYKKAYKCDWEECCNEEYIPHNIRSRKTQMTLSLLETKGRLEYVLRQRLYGQHIAMKTVLSALDAHTSSHSSPKALTLSFHGLAGSGKNYVASMIVEQYFKKSRSSKYYHFFNGRTEFPMENQLHYNQERLRKQIIESLIECPESVFVFDEVDMMTPGLLNILVPFMDYGASQIYHEGKFERIEMNKAIYIFLSNTGSQEIVKTLTDLWEQGKRRDETTLSDFENLIATGAFNEKGGFHKSDTISTSLIDHYVPFLPLEEEHVKLCITRAFRERGRTPTEELIKEAMSHVSFGPPPHNLYAKSGCKRVEQKVASIVYQRRH